MFTVSLVVFMVVVAFALLATGKKFGVSRAFAIIPAFLGAVILIVSCTTIINGKNVGVLTTFGKPTASLASGLHIKAPWQKVTELDGTNITSKFENDARIPARIGDGTTAHVSAIIRWNIEKEKADEIYGDFRSDDVNQTVKSDLVGTLFKNSIVTTFGEFNPTASLQAVDPAQPGANMNFVPDYKKLSENVQTILAEQIANSGGYINILSVTINGVDLSAETQKKINEFSTEIAKTQVAQQAKKTAAAQAAANKELSSSISNDPNVLVSRCFDTMQQMVEAAQPIPTGFSCWPGKDSNLILTGK